MRFASSLIVCAALSALACRSRGNAEPGSNEPPTPAVATQVGAAQAAAAEPAVRAGTPPAAIGQPAPEFVLPDLDGKPVRLSDFTGKTVVLEWFNPECPFVKAAHTKGSLVNTAARHTDKGVVWLAINSGAPGKQGAGREVNVQSKQTFALKHPVLLDEQGVVGKLYGAKRTPHMFVIAPDGKLVYAGAIDNSPDGEGASPTDGKLVNYVEQAVADVTAGKPVAKAETEAYGCSVKYAN